MLTNSALLNRKVLFNFVEIGNLVTWPKAVFSKILIYERKAIATFAALSWETVSGTWNYIQIAQADWPEVVVIWAPFERQKIEVDIFEKTDISGFGTWRFTAKEDLNRQKEVFLLNFRPWPAQIPEIWSIFYGKKFI